jgi:hypothetical protein
MSVSSHDWGGSFRRLALGGGDGAVRHPFPQTLRDARPIYLANRAFSGQNQGHGLFPNSGGFDRIRGWPNHPA